MTSLNIENQIPIDLIISQFAETDSTNFTVDQFIELFSYCEDYLNDNSYTKEDINQWRCVLLSRVPFRAWTNFDSLRFVEQTLGIMLDKEYDSQTIGWWRKTLIDNIKQLKLENEQPVQNPIQKAINYIREISH
jgi:hypothetical protein